MRFVGIVIGAFLLILVGLILLWEVIQEKTEIHDPNSKVGQKVDEVIGLKPLKTYEKAKETLAEVDLRDVEGTTARSILGESRNPLLRQLLIP